METMDRRRIVGVYKILSSAMRSRGSNLSFPENTKPEKTYIWRYLTKFLQFIDENDIDDYTMDKMIQAVVNYAAENKQLSRGAALLCKADILDLAYKKLLSEVDECNVAINGVKSSKMFIEKHKSEYSAVRNLLFRKTSKADANITRWFRDNRITKSFLAVSKSSIQAMQELPAEERRLLPKPIDLMRLRTLYLTNPVMLEELQKLLVGDLMLTI